MGLFSTSVKFNNLCFGNEKPNISEKKQFLSTLAWKSSNKKAFQSNANHPLSQMNKFKQVLGRGQGRWSRDTPEVVPV